MWKTGRKGKKARQEWKGRGTEQRSYEGGKGKRKSIIMKLPKLRDENIVDGSVGEGQEEEGRG